MHETLRIVEAVVVLIGGPLLALYLRERVKNLAREATDKALADYRHTQEQTLAQLNAAYQRRLQEFGLFAQRQHQVYAEMYRLVRIAADGYSGVIGYSESPDFSKYDNDDIHAFLKRRKIKESEAVEGVRSTGERR